MNRRDFIFSFVDRYDWILLPDGRGEFSVSPDTGTVKRVFSSDLKMRKSGTMLLGIIGIVINTFNLSSIKKLELSAYITNFDEFSSPPIIYDIYSLNDWVDKIVYNVNLLPLTINSIRDQMSIGVLGNFPSNVFKESSPDYSEFSDFIYKN